MSTLAELCHAEDQLLHKTAFKVFDLSRTESQAEGVAWWEELNEEGGGRRS
jgi:hypothetical protein